MSSVISEDAYVRRSPSQIPERVITVFHHLRDAPFCAVSRSRIPAASDETTCGSRIQIAPSCPYQACDMHVGQVRSVIFESSRAIPPLVHSSCRHVPPVYKHHTRDRERFMAES